MASSRSRSGDKRQRNTNDGWADAGGYMAAKVQKLENQFVEQKNQSAVTKESDIFKNISIFVNGYTKPSSDVLKKLMQQHGGTYHHYYARSKVTHIVATNLPNSKIANLTDKKVVHPDWITESIKANKLLQYQDFLLYKAETKRQPSIKLLAESNSTAISTEEGHSVCDNFNDPTVEPRGDKESEPNIEHEGNNENHLRNATAESDLSPTRNVASSVKVAAKAGDPNFVSEFYGHSRLHHISQWSVEMKAYVRKLQAEPSDFCARSKLKQIAEERRKHAYDIDSQDTPTRVIMHIDMDSFFVSVGIRDRPHLKGKPVAVTHSKGSNKTSKAAEEAGFHGSTSEIASCSYEARQKGVKNGMFLGGARELCPDIVCIPYDFQGYSEVSRQLYDLVASYTHYIEAVSCDEMFVDLTSLLSETGATPLEVACLMRREILEATRCAASAGLGENMLLARLATTKAKPNGQYHVTSDETIEFMEEIPVRSLPGVGRMMCRKLEDLGVATCSDLQQISLKQLQSDFGNKTGLMLHNFCRGKDERRITTEKVRKSVSAEINYGIRFKENEEAVRFIGELAEEVSKRLTAVPTKGKTITLKLKVRAEHAPVESAKFLGHGICDSYAKSVTLASSTNQPSTIAKECVTLLNSLHVSAEDIRGMGIQISRLDLGDGSPPASSGVRSILQFTEKIQKVTTDSDTFTAPQKPDSPIKIPEPRPRELPPLPSLDLSSQQLTEFRFDIAKGDSSANSDTRVPASQKPAQSQYFPNASQIDEAVLAELPEDIQEEIRREMAAKYRQKASESRFDLTNERVTTGDADLHTSQEAGCSHWSGYTETAPVVSLADTAVKKIIPVLKQAPLTPKKASPKKSPTKKRGRPRKLQLPKNQSPSKPTGITSAIRSNDAQVNQPAPVPEIAPPPPRTDCTPSLCGAVSLAEVKALLQQWLQDSSDPCDEDVDRFLQYSSALVQAHNLEQLLLLLRYLRRLSRRLNEQWVNTVEDITSQAKVIVKSVYGSELKV